MKKKSLLIMLFLCFIASPCVAEEIDVFWLVERGTPAQLQEALSNGAKFNVKRSISDFDVDNMEDMDTNGWLCDYRETPLHRAAAYNKNPEVIKFLIEQGLDVNAEGYVGQSSVITPLSCAIEHKNVEAVKELLKAGAKSGIYISSGIPTPLHFIAVQYKKSFDTAKSMIEAIANASGDVNIHSELTAEDIASLNEYEEDFAKYKTIFIPRNQWTSDNPIDNMRDFSNATIGHLLATLTPLMYAVLYDNIDVVNILLDVNADANIKSAENKTALDYANELPDNYALKKSSAFERLKAATTVKSADTSSDKNFERADRLVAEGKIPMYVRDKGKFVYNPKMAMVRIMANNVRLRSQPNGSAKVVDKVNKIIWGSIDYLGEWTHPNGDKWIVGIYDDWRYVPEPTPENEKKIIWVSSKYAKPVTLREYQIWQENTYIPD